MSHGLIAVHGLGGSPTRLEEFWEVHSKHDVLGMQLEPARQPQLSIGPDEWKARLGHMDRYPEYFQFFEKELEQRGLQFCVEKYLPELVKQVAAHAFHPFIHLGFSLYFAQGGASEGELCVGDALVPLAEGFAACAVAERNLTGMHTGLPPDSRGQEADLVRCVGEIFEKAELSDVYSEAFAKANFSERIAVVKATIGPHMVAMVNQWYFDVLGSAEAIADEQKQRALLQHVGRTAFAAHWGAQCSDFFLLHGVTAFFALVQVVRTLTNPDTIGQTILNFAYSLLLTYAAVGAPKLRPLSQVVDCGSSWAQIVDIVRPDGSEKNDEVRTPSPLGMGKPDGCDAAHAEAGVRFPRTGEPLRQRE
jgi:hypothetical protein